MTAGVDGTRLAVRESVARFVTLLAPAAAAAAGLAVLAGGPALGSPVLMGAVVVSLMALHGFDLQISRGPDRFALDVIELPLIVAFVHLPVAGGLLAATAGHTAGMWFETRDMRGLTDPGRRWDWLQFRSNLTARVLGLAAGYSLLEVVPANSLGAQIGRAAAAGLVCVTVADLVVVAIASRITGLAETGRMLADRSLYPLVLVGGIGAGALLALAGVTLGRPAEWLLAGAATVVWATWLHEHADTNRRRLQGLMAASGDLHASQTQAQVRDQLLVWARRLTHATYAAVRLSPPTVEELGVELGRDEEHDTSAEFLVVAGRRGLTSSFRRRDRELLAGLANIGATAMRRAELHDRLAARANNDRLTGLANRWMLRETFDRMAAQARRNRTVVAVLFVDVNHLKEVNDTHGHDAGDALLIEVADRLRTHARDADLVARWGGDEFVVLGHIPTQAEAKALTDRFKDAFEAPLAIAGDIPAGASIGLACWPDDAETFDALLRAADQAMYRHKHVRRWRPDTGDLDPGRREPA